MELMKPLTFDENGKSSTAVYQNALADFEIKRSEDEFAVWLKASLKEEKRKADEITKNLTK